MRRIIFILFLLIISACGEKLSQTYHQNGQLASEGKTLNGQSYGLWKFYYEDGSKESETYFNKGVRHGNSIRWFPSGVIQGKGEYNEGKVKGTWKAYFDNGQLEKIFTVIDGEMHEDYIEYYPNGQIRRKGEMEMGKEIGQWFTYYESGKVKSKTITTDIKGEGFMTIYYESGGKQREGKYINQSKEQGIWNYWDEQGRLIDQIEYNNGEIKEK